MKYVYGPVPSRRLGSSLGIDPIPLKTCNWNCVYCQLGRTRPVVTERKRYYPTEEILAEIDQALDINGPQEIDWITLVGSGEPTLHSEIGLIIQEIKKRTSIPVAVITNGSLLYLPEVRRDLAGVEAVLPSLDAGSREVYRKINRPHPGATYQDLVEGLIAFRQEFGGQLWVEVMLVRGINDTPATLRDLHEALRKINPDQIQLNTPTRPPVETWVRAPDEAGMRRAVSILGAGSEVLAPARGEFHLADQEHILEELSAIIGRHPVSQEDLIGILKTWGTEEIDQVLADLEGNHLAYKVKRGGVVYWVPAGAYFPEG
jgi:wyosine [tRNA(Phe)-imidazoG37] synthetase (radical SAM superfamily)